MPIICQLTALPAEPAAALLADPGRLATTLASAQRYTGVYRYWHGIHHLLSLHTPPADLLGQGLPVSAADGDIPAARLLDLRQVQALDAALQEISPESLAEQYDAGVLDAAGIYPRCWEAWEESFDPLGQLLEHYFYLQSFAHECATEGRSLLLSFSFLNDGSDD